MRKNAATLQYDIALKEVVQLLETSRRTSARAVNIIMTTTYWQIGRRIVELEQEGKVRATYQSRLLQRLSTDLTTRFGRGFSADNLETMRLFYVAYPKGTISETLSRKSTPHTSTFPQFPLPWSHYVLLVRRVTEPKARAFYETEGLRSGWSVRQLDRQIATQFYERTTLSRNKAHMLKNNERHNSDTATTPEEVGKFTHADAGQMHLYLNYARQHWQHPDENPPVGLILCTQKDAIVARYALDGLPNKVLAAEYRMTLPDEETLAAALQQTRKRLENMAPAKQQSIS